MPAELPVKAVMHPGFPNIGAIKLFRRNAKTELDKGNAELDKAIKKIKEFPDVPIVHNDRTALKIRKPQPKDTPILFNAYFDKTAYKSMINKINEVIKEKMRQFMSEALDEARIKTAQTVETMDRAFKSSMRSGVPAAGDLYEKIADSLDFEETLPSSAGYFNNQFAGFIAGSREDGTFFSDLTGVRGSRMGAEDKNLIELTEDGYDGFPITKIGAYFAGIRRNPAKRMLGD